MDCLSARLFVGICHVISSTRRHAWRSPLFVSALLSSALLLSASADAALHEYRVSFAPSASSSAVGYTLHIGEQAGDYTGEFDLGRPPTSGSGGTIIYAVDLEDSIDLFVSLRAYDTKGSTSEYSNEIQVSAVVPPAPAPEPDPLPEPVPEPEPLPEPPPAPNPLPEPEPEPEPTPNPEPDEMPVRTLFFEDFEGVSVGQDPVDWLDTGRKNGLDENPELFFVGPVPEGGQGLVTYSSDTNIHSHYATTQSGEWWDYEYFGRMLYEDPSAGIGVTILSDYPNSDSYLRLRRWKGQTSFAIAPHSASRQDACVGLTDSGVESRPNTWFHFRFRVEDENGATRVLARVWDASDPEPADWQIDCLWTAWPDAVGRPGVWSMGSGQKMWDDLGAIEINSFGVGAGQSNSEDDNAGLSSVYANNFDDLADGRDPEGWIDTARDNASSVADSLFKVGTAPDGGHALVTRSEETNIHSHYVAGDAATWQNYEYSGRMHFASAKSGIGVTIYSGYPESDRYLRLRRHAKQPEFHLASHGGTGSQCVGSTNIGFASRPDVWYAFKLRALDENGDVRVQAKVWPEATDEPADWQIDCVTPDSGPHTVGGAPGVWSMGSGTKYWDNLEVMTPSIPAPD